MINISLRNMGDMFAYKAIEQFEVSENCTEKEAVVGVWCEWYEDELWDKKLNL